MCSSTLLSLPLRNLATMGRTLSQNPSTLIHRSPLIVDTDVRNLTDVMKRTLLNAEVIQLHQSTATPPGTLLGRDWSCSVDSSATVLGPCGSLYGRKADPEGSSWVVALVNEDDKVARRLTLSLSLLGWGCNATAIAKDLWNSTAVSESVTGGLARTVAPHSTALVKLTLNA